MLTFVLSFGVLCFGLLFLVLELDFMIKFMTINCHYLPCYTITCNPISDSSPKVVCSQLLSTLLQWYTAATIAAVSKFNAHALEKVAIVETDLVEHSIEFDK